MNKNANILTGIFYSQPYSAGKALNYFFQSNATFT